MDKPLFSLCMPMFKTEKFLKRAVDSICDQDIPEWELIVCLDGPSKRAEKILKPFTKDPRVRYITIPHGGACAARNAAAKLSSGKYISFFSSDFIMFPGTLSLWLDYLEDHPDYDFLYGPYKITDKEAILFPEFSTTDYFLLSTRNYIDGGFPMKREIWEEHPWDESIYSLNDWDFWLNVLECSKHEHKGFFIHEATYSAEAPRSGGLSEHSNKNWLEVTGKIKAKHKIPVREICMASWGAGYHVKGLAELVGADMTFTPWHKPNRYKMIYMLGFYVVGADKHARFFLPSQHTEKAKKVIHWIGGDTWQLGELIGLRKVKKLVRSFNDRGIIHLCETPEAQKELTEYGINAIIVPIPSLVEDKYEVLPKPKTPKIAVYFPMKEKDPYQKYLQSFVANLIKQMPETKFVLYGSERNDKENNIEFRQWVDMKELASECSAILRLVQHDSTPVACLDFIQFGREAITNIPGFPHMHFIETGEYLERKTEDILADVKTAIKNIKSGKKLLNTQGVRNYYKREFSQKQYKEKIWSLANAQE